MATTTTPAWPASLPAPRFDGYSIAQTAAFTRSNMDSGTARQRRRFVSTPKQITVSWRVTTSQLKTFEDFFSDDLVEGTLWFTVPMASGAGLVSVLARFTEPPKEAGAGDPNLWDISGTLETMSLRGASNG